MFDFFVVGCNMVGFFNLYVCLFISDLESCGIVVKWIEEEGKMFDGVVIIVVIISCINILNLCNVIVVGLFV